MAFGPAGEPIYGVYPSMDGREPSFPNPTANLVSTKREQVCVMQGGSIASFIGIALAYFFVLPVFRAAFFFPP